MALAMPLFFAGIYADAVTWANLLSRVANHTVILMTVTLTLKRLWTPCPPN